jgi:hypothetical protein
VTRLAWALNLDCEHELAARGSYTPARHVRALVARERGRLLDALVGKDDVIVSDEDTPAARGLLGVAWSPTPRALAQLRAAGARPAAAPTVEVLRAVNARPFAAGVRAPLARGSTTKQVAGTLDETLAQLARPAPQGWLVRRTFGAAGRGRRRITAGKPDAAERAWIEAGLRRGPLVIEPWVEVTREFTRSAWVRSGGEVVISPPCFQRTTNAGAWVTTELADRVPREDDARLEEAVAAAGTALARAGYFGPFGIDAFRHRAPGTAREVLNPLSEINARFTMDWATAMVGSRRDVLAESLA